MLSSHWRDVAVDNRPYAHVAVDDALIEYAALERDFPVAERFGQSIRSHGDLTYPDREYCALIGESDGFRKLHDWVYSVAFCQFFLDVFRSEIDRFVAAGALLFDPRELEIRPEPFEGREMLGRKRAPRNEPSNRPFIFPRLDLGVGRLGYGKVNGGRGVHVDNLTRLVSILVYVDDNPSMVGGEHRMYGLTNYQPAIERVYRPKANLLVASLQSNLAFHDVNPVTAIDGVRKALYMAVSCSTEIWKSQTDRTLARMTRNRYQPTFMERVAGKIKRSLLKAGDRTGK